MTGVQTCALPIFLWHCLEHLPSPWSVVREAAERLAPGGILLVAIPNIESYEFSKLKGNWRHLDTPRHLYFYPVDSLVALCQTNGLAKLEVTTKDELSDVLSKDAWHAVAVSKVPIKYVRGALGLLLFYAARKKEKNNVNSGSGMTAVFQRPLAPQDE